MQGNLPATALRQVGGFILALITLDIGFDWFPQSLSELYPGWLWFACRPKADIYSSRPKLTNEAAKLKFRNPNWAWIMQSIKESFDVFLYHSENISITCKYTNIIISICLSHLICFKKQRWILDYDAFLPFKYLKSTEAPTKTPSFHPSFDMVKVTLMGVPAIIKDPCNLPLLLYRRFLVDPVEINGLTSTNCCQCRRFQSSLWEL